MWPARARKVVFQDVLFISEVNLGHDAPVTVNMTFKLETIFLMSLERK